MPDAAITDGLAALKNLRPKIRRFAQEYVTDFNGKQAAIRAGYAVHTAAVIASQHLIKLNVQQAISALVKRHADKLDLTSEQVITGVARICEADPRKLFDDDGRLKKPKDWDDNTALAVASYDGKNKTVRFWSKPDAYNLAARILRLIGGDDLPRITQNTFVVIAPAGATPEDWAQLSLTCQHPTVLTHGGSGNGTPHPNGDGD